MQAESREHLKKLLDGRKANGIIFTTMQKFEESNESLSERKNIIVMADEAHRGQYGLTEKIKTTKVTLNALIGYLPLDFPVSPFEINLLINVTFFDY